MELPRSAQLLRAVGVEAEELALAGGGVWAFGSRAAGCAVATSDWDFLVVEPRREEPAHERHAELDLVYVGRADFLRGWRTSELAGHVSRWGVRLAAHDDLVLRALPGEAAPRKCRVVRNRARQLASFWTAFQAGQQAREATRLRRDLQRAWLLSQGLAVPPTAMLDRAWGVTSEDERRAMLQLIPLSKVVEEAVRA